MKGAIVLLGNSLWVVITLLVLGFAYAEADDPVALEDRPSVFTETVDRKSGWKWITNERFGFAVRLPASSRIVDRRVEWSHEYVRFQGEYPRESMSQFVLEMFLVDQVRRQRWREPCPGRLFDLEVKTRDGQKVYAGNLEDESGDSPGWSWRGLCAESDLVHVWMQGAEKSEGTPILKKVYGSFRFIQNATVPYKGTR